MAVTVEGDADEGVDEDGEPAEDDGVPGFGIVVGLGALGVVIAIGFARRRSSSRSSVGSR